MKKRLNCWEYKKCGREPGGDNIIDDDICPASIDSSCDGFNGGKNGGRICWSIAGTLCKGFREGTFANKLDTCLQCDFFLIVLEKEDPETFKWFK